MHPALEADAAPEEAPTAINELAILNSFFIRDLERVLAQAKDRGLALGSPLACYLQGAGEKKPDLLLPEGKSLLMRNLAMERMPPGRWPGEDVLLIRRVIYDSAALVHGSRNGAEDPTVAVSSVVALALALSGEHIRIHLSQRNSGCELLQQTGLRRTGMAGRLSSGPGASSCGLCPGKKKIQQTSKGGVTK